MRVSTHFHKLTPKVIVQCAALIWFPLAKTYTYTLCTTQSKYQNDFQIYMYAVHNRR